MKKGIVDQRKKNENLIDQLWVERKHTLDVLYVKLLCIRIRNCSTLGPNDIICEQLLTQTKYPST